MSKSMSIAAALVMRDSLANSAAKELVKEKFAPQEQEAILNVFKQALARGQSDLEKYLPKIDEADLANLVKDTRKQAPEPSPH